MNGYICFYNDKQLEIYANSSYEAQKKAQAELKLKDKDCWKITVMLAEFDGKQYTHTAID